MKTICTIDHVREHVSLYDPKSKCDNVISKVILMFELYHPLLWRLCVFLHQIVICSIHFLLLFYMNNCHDRQIDGDIVAPNNPSKWGAATKGLVQWITFSKLHNMLVIGRGTINGNGAPWWSAFSSSKVITSLSSPQRSNCLFFYLIISNMRK